LFMDLLTRMLSINIATRISPAQVLAHPYLI
jgi:hypothetical protein